MDPTKISEIAQATSSIPTIAWLSIIIIGLIVIFILLIVNIEKISLLLFGEKKGILVKNQIIKNQSDIENPHADIENPHGITTYISSWLISIKFSESLRISNTENLLDFLKFNLTELNNKKVSLKKLVLDLSDTYKINSTALKDITTFIELIASNYQTIELTIELNVEPSEQLLMAQKVWNSLIESFKIGGRNDINVSIICKK
jgi:hypothetical protein